MSAIKIVLWVDCNQAKHEMRELAGSTRDTLKDIFVAVRTKHPKVADRLSYASVREQRR